MQGNTASGDSNSNSVSELFSESNLFQSYLDVEAALARAQASQGIIPTEAAGVGALGALLLALPAIAIFGTIRAAWSLYN